MAMTDTRFVSHSLLDILVPESTNLDIEQALQASVQANEQEGSLLNKISPRDLLYFDEELALYAILRTPYDDPVSLKAHIARLAIIVEAHAISSPATTNEGAATAASGQARDVIWSSRLDVSEDPILVVEGSEDGDEQDALLIWKMNAFLSRPRVRLQAPAIIFKVSASLQPAPVGNTQVIEDYLPSGVPFPTNVLEPLATGSELPGSLLHLPALRLSGGNSLSNVPRSEVLPLKVVSRRAYRAIPAISSRMRYHRSNDATNRSMIIGSLELDVPIFAQYPIELTKIGVEFSTGEQQQLIGGQSLELPMVCSARDSVACLYALAQPNGPPTSNGQSSSMKSLDIMINATVRASAQCLPQIQIRWKQNIDFATALNAKFNRVRGSIHRNNRPRSLSTNANGQNSVAAGDNTRQFISEDMGLSTTITGRQGINIGQPFTWDILILNKSTKARQFVLSALLEHSISQKQRGTSRPTSTQQLPATIGGVLADAVVDENILYTVIRSQVADATPLVPISSDIRTGILEPGACFSTEMELLPLAKGPLYMHCVRIMDIESNEVVEITDLPDILVVDDDGEVAQA